MGDVSEKTFKRIAYFSMEIGFDPSIPTYSGGLGVLAGDTIKACADLAVPMIAVTLLHDEGYFFQRIDEAGNQREFPVEWNKDNLLSRLPERVEVKIAGRTVRIGVWEGMIRGLNGYAVPVYFLDTNLEENSPADRGLTARLYGGDLRYRLAQEIILGIGGVRMIDALGYSGIEKYHLNEGHAAFLALELLHRERKDAGRAPDRREIHAVSDRCVFTTHTPVPAGHDRFPREMVKKTLDSDIPEKAPELFYDGEELSTTLTALNLSRYVNGVAKRHGEVSRRMFPGYRIESITNGVHLPTWTSPPFRSLFDRYIPEWSQDAFSLRYALSLPPEKVWQAHSEAKKGMIDYINRRHNLGMAYDALTIGFARRATAYKRADLLLRDPDRLAAVAEKLGPLQVVYGGKAHPADAPGKEMIRRIVQTARRLHPRVRIVYLENYDFSLARILIAGCDLWLNTPRPPMEASGTSGMKAAVNGVPSLSVLDGWWIEGCIENITGWSIGPPPGPGAESPEDGEIAEEIYRKLEETILPMYYGRREEWIRVMLHAIALNASFFNTRRMVMEYVTNAYFLKRTSRSDNITEENTRRS